MEEGLWGHGGRRRWGQGQSPWAQRGHAVAPGSCRTLPDKGNLKSRAEIPRSQSWDQPWQQW